MQVWSLGAGRPPGGGNGNPLQYSWLESSMDRGAWWATVHGVAESDMAEWVNTCGESRFLWGWHILGTAGGPAYQSRVSERENEEVWGATEERGCSEGDGELWKLRVTLQGGGTRLGLGYNRISPATMFTNRHTKSQAAIIIWTANSHALDQVMATAGVRGDQM